MIDTTQNGWYLYTGSSQDLSNVQTVLYEYQQKLQPKELTAIHLDLKNKQNSYGNSYRHQAFGNSLSDYKVPISSNIVEHSVKGRRISGKVWLDENRDGQLQSAEPKLKNVPVSLYRKDGSNYVLVLKNLRDESLKGIKTDAAGNYAFEYLATGEYIVSFDQKASVLKNKKITTFDTGDKATSSKVDKDNQLSGITGWNTVLSEDFPLLKDMADNCYEQINLHLGVYTVNVPPPKPPDPLDPPEPSKPPGPAPSTTDDSNSSTTSNSSGKDSSTSESSETEKSGVGGIGGKNIPPGSQINRKDLPVTNSKRSLLPKTNDLSGTLFIVFGVCLLILSGSILIKRSKQSK